MKEIECVVRSSCELGEGPVWLPHTSSLYWVDIPPPSKLYEWNLNSKHFKVWELPDVVTALAPRQQHGLIVVSRNAINGFDFSSGQLDQIAIPDPPFRSLRFNDCGCDALGRLWTGSMLDTFGEQKAKFPTKPEDFLVGSLYRIDPDHTIHEQKYGVGCPNTFLWSPDSKYMYTIDSATEQIYQYHYDLASGEISDCAQMIDMPLPGVPDGSAMDKAGYFWNARWGGSCVIRFSPDGQVDQKVDVPAKLVTSCAFGGIHLDTLFITTAKHGLTADELIEYPMSGGIFAFKPQVSGLPVPPFLG